MAERNRRHELEQRVSRLSPAEQERLRRAIADRSSGEWAGELARIPASPLRTPGDLAVFPLSYPQERMWLAEQRQPDVPRQVTVRYRLRGELRTEPLRRSLEALVERHESLRTVFSTVRGEPVQRIRAPGRFELPVSAGDPAPQPLDLEEGPLIRATLQRLGPGDHRLTLQLHHLVFDGWSLGNLNRELSLLYPSFRGGRSQSEGSTPLPALPIQYPDFAHWQRERFAGLGPGDLPAGYRTLLETPPPELELPSDRGREATAGYRGARESFLIDAALARGLASVAQRRGASQFMVLLAAYATLLGRYSGQDELVVGSPVSGRDRPELEPLIGLFLNLQPLRIDLSGNPGFHQLLSRVRERCLEMLELQAIPFERLEERSPRLALRAMLILQNAPLPQPELTGVIVEKMLVDSDAERVDLTLSLHSETGGLRAAVRYDRALFDPSTIERFAGHFQTLLAGIAADPERRIADLPLLTEGERRKLIGWSSGRSAPEAEEGLARLFAAQVEETPHDLAFVDGQEELDFSQLQLRSNALAATLAAHGMAPGDFVGLCSDRSLGAMVAAIGIVEAGGVVVPLDPAYPGDRLAYIAGDSRLSFVVSDLPELPWRASGSLRVIRPQAVGRSAPAAPERARLDLAAPAWVTYTSGSTGPPKGVTLSQRQILNRLQWMWRRYPFAAGELCAQKTALSFVDAIWEIFGPLLCGIGSVVVPEATVRDPQAMIDLLARHRVSRLWVVPSLLRMLLAVEPALGRRLPALSFWVTTGEPLPIDLWRRFRAAAPDATLFNLYGTSETWDVSWYDPSIDGPPLERVPIGRAIDNVQSFVFDERRQLVPVGVVGELFVGGLGVGDGYLARPELTSERYLEHPFDPTPGARLFRTGDLARYRDDGNLELIGRRDQQLKIRGVRIETGEVESWLERHPAVRQAAVCGYPDPHAGPELLAFLVPADGTPPVERELRSLLRVGLPPSMLPGRAFWIATLPATPSGKLDRAALAPELAIGPVGSGSPRVPRDSLEQQLKNLWELVLGSRPEGVGEDFFDLGGDSLRLVRLCAGIEEFLDARLPMAALFGATTIAAQAEVLRQQGREPVWSSLVGIEPKGSRRPFYCVPPAARTVSSLGSLARHLGPDRPFFGLQPLGLEGEAAPHRRVEDMALHYLREVRSFQPTGPYLLGGACYGGVVALEMARCLETEGETVAALVVFDELASPGEFRAPPQGWAWHRRRVRNHARRWLHHPVQHLRRILRIGELRSRRRILAIADRRVRRLEEAHTAARRAFRPTPSDGRVTLFRNAEAGLPYPTRWDELARGGVSCHLVPGDHLSMWWEPQIQELARLLRTCLDEADPRTG